MGAVEDRYGELRAEAKKASAGTKSILKDFRLYQKEAGITDVNEAIDAYLDDSESFGDVPVEQVKKALKGLRRSHNQRMESTDDD